MILSTRYLPLSDSVKVLSHQSGLPNVRDKVYSGEDSDQHLAAVKDWLVKYKIEYTNIRRVCNTSDCRGGIYEITR